MKHDVKPTNTTPPAKGSFMTESTTNHRHHSWVSCLVTSLVSCFSFARVVVFSKSFSRWIVLTRKNHYCECGQLKTVEHVLNECSLHPTKRDFLRNIFPELNLKILLDTKKGLGAIVKLDLLPKLLCRWFYWLEQLVEVLLSANLWYRSTGCYVSQFFLTHKVIYV